MNKARPMADGREDAPRPPHLRPFLLMTLPVNDARAMRVAEVMNDFRTLQYHIAQYQAVPPPEQYHDIGYEALRQCIAEAQAVLSAHYDTGSLQIPSSAVEQQRQQLRR